MSFNSKGFLLSVRYMKKELKSANTNHTFHNIKIKDFLELIETNIKEKNQETIPKPQNQPQADDCLDNNISNRLNNSHEEEQKSTSKHSFNEIILMKNDKNTSEVNEISQKTWKKR